ncbi:nickel-dependent hydrogenase large subunit [Azospira restricta]|uniref:Nickel-dependent hydrogenase large subunit n=1 Tax=Azospira restricta TaxID=404405 RepID=A0A974SQV6_9RHOO|nr:nickel-dependent hydrogenase large subunit [Azospira restricta]QRJ64724.1 nickel-dependent hydrogenase large subunit [Azospira restricta]
MSRLVIGPFNRVEGDLEVALDVADGRVRGAEVSASLYRGFENLLVGRDPLDALVLVPRICGICSVSQSAAAAAALAAAAGLVMPANGRLAQNLIHCCENLADHLTHFYCFFMPDFARDGYAGAPWHAGVAERFRAQRGSALADWLPARTDFLRVLGYLAGKWPHTLALQPGGTTRAITPTEKVRLAEVLREFRDFLETTLFADALEAFAALDSPAALAAWAEARDGDLARFVRVALALGLERVGRAGDRFLSFGAYAAAGGPLLPRGVWQDGAALALDPAAIVEDVSHAWLEDGAALPPAAGETRPLADPDAKPAAYSWCKAPRYAGRAVETGALARQLLAGQPLAASLVAAHGGSVLARVVARMSEVARLLPQMEQWLREIAPGEPFCAEWTAPQDAHGVGLVEAARGALGHWLTIERGRIAGYQIVAPTTWNFSPRDAAGQPGALEQALVGLPVGAGERNPPIVQHVVRSFDPCMVCTVH